MFEIIKGMVYRSLQTKERRGLVSSLVVALFCFSMGLLTQHLYYVDALKPLDVATFQKRLAEKEAFSAKWMKYIRDNLASNDLTEVRKNRLLYEQSMENEVAFHVYGETPCSIGVAICLVSKTVSTSIWRRVPSCVWITPIWWQSNHFTVNIGVWR